MNFHSRGKFLISGEYLVIDGASALTVPLTKGQDLSISSSDHPGLIQWSSRQYGKEWFSCSIDISLFEVLKSSDKATAINLLNLLRSAHSLNPDFLKGNDGFTVTTDLGFNREWGFGSSSSLISNIASWAEIDGFDLHKSVSSGSGYDVIAAGAQQPLIFTRRADHYTSEFVDFRPAFRNNFWFIYLGLKSNSSKNVEKYLKLRKPDKKVFQRISEITRDMASSHHLENFEHLMTEHDSLLSKVLGLPRLKETHFADLIGEIKPMGAWGGDFAMLIWRGSKNELLNYLKPKNISVVFSFDEIVKTK